MKDVLSQPIPPPNEKWHLLLQGHDEDLFDAIHVIEKWVDILYQEWLDEDKLLICLDWVDDTIAWGVQTDIEHDCDYVTVKKNGREICQGHSTTT